MQIIALVPVTVFIPNSFDGEERFWLGLDEIGEPWLVLPDFQRQGLFSVGQGDVQIRLVVPSRLFQTLSQLNMNLCGYRRVGGKSDQFLEGQ